MKPLDVPQRATLSGNVDCWLTLRKFPIYVNVEKQILITTIAYSPSWLMKPTPKTFQFGIGKCMVQYLN